MRAALALVLTLPALAGCASLEELDPMAMACREAPVQEAGWCGGTGGSAEAAAPDQPKVEASADGVRWTHDLAGSHGRFSFAWDSPGQAQVSWAGVGSGGMWVSVRDAGGNTLYNSAPNAGGDAQRLVGRAGLWTVSLDFDNFAGHARAELRAA